MAKARWRRRAFFQSRCRGGGQRLEATFLQVVSYCPADKKLVFDNEDSGPVGTGLPLSLHPKVPDELDAKPKRRTPPAVAMTWRREVICPNSPERSSVRVRTHFLRRIVLPINECDAS